MTGRLTHGVMWDVKTANYLKKRPDSAFAVFLAGWSALMWGDSGKAERFFNGAIAADADYAPAYIGLICLEILLGRSRKAALLLNKYSAKLNLAKKINRFRLCSAVGACAVKRIKDSPGKPSENRGLIAGVRFLIIDRSMRKLYSKMPEGAAKDNVLSDYHKLIRYIELLQRRGVTAATGAARVNKKDDAEQIKLADGICAMPGLTDEFRFYVLNDATVDTGDTWDIYLFDNPAIFTKALLNKLFREKILNGELREPRIILSNLRRDINARGIDNANKWLFLRLCQSMRRYGELETETARELESDGWWADPVVREYLRT